MSTVLRMRAVPRISIGPKGTSRSRVESTMADTGSSEAMRLVSLGRMYLMLSR